MENNKDMSIFVISSFAVFFFVFMFVRPTGYAVGSLLGTGSNSLMIIGIVFIVLILALGIVYFIYKKTGKKKVIANIPLPSKENKEKDILEGIAEHKEINIDVDKLFSSDERPIEKAERITIERANEKRLLTNLNDLKVTIIGLLRQRYSKQQILGLLQSKGWTIEQIEKAINEINLDSLRGYVNNALKEGFTKEQVKQMLLRNGWSEEAISKVM
ncbi:MAG: hypothetical protein V1663_04545 [archaeon]